MGEFESNAVAAMDRFAGRARDMLASRGVGKIASLAMTPAEVAKALGVSRPRTPVPVTAGFASLDPSFVAFLRETAPATSPSLLVVNAVMSVTPAIARAWLKRNHRNRTLNKGKVRKFAALMGAGRWTLNGEPVKFSAEGALLDGQSRLQAIVLGGGAVLLEVRWGLARSAQESMDTGEARTHVHQLQMSGLTGFPFETAAAARIVYHWENGLKIGSNLSQAQRALLDNTAIREVVERHPALCAGVKRFASSETLRLLVTLTAAAAFHYLFSKADADKADRFFSGLQFGIDLSPTSPITIVREKLRADRLSQARVSRRERWALLVKAWNAYYAGEEPSSIEFRTTGDNPELFPEIAGLPRPAGR